MRALSTLALLIVFLSGCVSIPSSVDGEFPPISLEQARKGDAKQSVRWGGVIAKVSNEDKQSVIEIVAKPLSSSSRPIDKDETGGRFLAILPEFVDPLIYEKGREITVVGQLSNVIEGKVGDMKYLYPVVMVSGHYLWKPRSEFNDYHHHIGPSFWPYPYYYHYPHWQFHPGPGEPGSRPNKKPRANK
ncbi:MAG: Slp family lipoprotein [Gammaproteobacteria bacterium]|nr:Slp family lipoprotein [Gammaproteobacteria bacterium]